MAAIKAKMAEYCITVADLGGSARAGKAAKVKGEAKYRGPNGELWSGKGRSQLGPARHWLLEKVSTTSQSDQPLLVACA